MARADDARQLAAWTAVPGVTIRRELGKVDA